MERSPARDAAGSTPAGAPPYPGPVPPDLAEAVARYGDGLGDYCRMWLGDVPAAAVAETVRAALLLARDREPGGGAHGGRYGRARLYALARVCCLIRLTRPAHGAASIAGAPPRSRAADAVDPALAGLQALDRRQREVLELSFRHGLERAEIAAVTGLGDERVEALLTEAQDAYEAWVNTVLLARASRAACAEGAELAAAWERNPGRSARTRLRVHVTGCATCSAPAKLTVDAGALLRRIPVTPLTGEQRAIVLDLDASAPTGVEWRADGFPVQPDPERPAAPTEPLHAPVLTAGLTANRTTGFWDDDPDTPVDDLDVTKPIRILKHVPGPGAGASGAGGRPSLPPAFGSGGRAASPNTEEPWPEDRPGEAGDSGDTAEVARPSGSGAGERRGPGAARRRNPWSRSDDGVPGDSGDTVEVARPSGTGSDERRDSDASRRRNPWSRFDDGLPGEVGDSGDTVEVARPSGTGAGERRASRRESPWSRFDDGPSGGDGPGEPEKSFLSSKPGPGGRRGTSDASRRESPWRRFDDDPSGGLGGPLRLGRRTAPPLGDTAAPDGLTSGVGTFQQRRRPDPGDLLGSGLGSHFDAGGPGRYPRRRRPGKALVIGSGLAVAGGLLWAAYGVASRTDILGVANETPVGAAPPATPSASPSATASANGTDSGRGGDSGRTPGAAASSGGVPADAGYGAAPRGGGTPEPTATAGARAGADASGSGGAGGSATPGATRSPGEAAKETGAASRPGGTATPAAPKGGVPDTSSTTAPTIRPSTSPKPTPTARRAAPRSPSPTPTRSAAKPARLVVTVADGGNQGQRTLLLRAVNGTVAWQATVSTPLLQLSARQGITANQERDRLRIRLTPHEVIAAQGGKAVDQLFRTCGSAQTATLRITWRGVNAAGARNQGVTPFRIRFVAPCP